MYMISVAAAGRYGGEPMRQIPVAKVVLWLAIVGTAGLIALVWLDSALRPLAISDSVVRLVRASDAQDRDIYRRVALLIRQGEFQLALMVTAIGILIIACLAVYGSCLANFTNHGRNETRDRE
jgi:hypothetical protein